MSDLVLESVRALVLAGIVVFLWRSGHRQLKGDHDGWGHIVAGFGLLLFGSLLDITDNFEELNRFVVIGDTEVEAFLEKLVGFLGGFAVLAWGLFRWVPKVAGLSAEIEQRQRAEQALLAERHMLDLRVQERTAEIDGANVKLQKEVAVRKHAEVALRASEARLRAIFNHAPMEIYLKDLGGRYMEINRRYEELWGVTNAEIRGKLPGEVYGDSVFAEASRTHDLSVLRGEQVIEQEIEVPIDGAVHTRRTIKFPIKSDDGEVKGLGAIAIDVTERRRAVVALRESEERYREIVENVGDFIQNVGPDQKYTFVNKAWKRALGYDEDDLSSLTFTDVLHEDFLPHCQEIFEGLGRGETFENVEVVFKAKDGREIAVEGHLSSVMDDGRLLRTLAIFRDVTERKQAERELEESREVLRSLADNLPEFISLKDPEGRFLFVNKRFEEWVRVDRNDIVGKTVHDIYSPEQAAEFEALDREAFDSRGVLSNELDLSYPDGNTRTVIRTRFPLLSSAGTILGLGTVNVDVSAHKRAEEALSQARDELEQRVEERTVELRSSRDQLRMVTDNLPILIMYMGADRRYRFANETCAQWYARAPEDIIGKTAMEIHGPEFDKFNPNVEAVLAGEAKTFEQVTNYPDGVTRDTRVIYVPHIGPNSEVLGFFSFVEDITDQRQAEAQLRQAQKMEAVGQLTGGVAHDFNNLLGIVMGNSELLAERVGEDDPQIRALMRAAIRGADLTQRLLAFSRRQPLQPKAIDTGRMVSDMVEMMRRSLGEAVEIKIESAPNLWTATADPGLLENALLNLAINARDAMSGGGTLIIETGNATLDEAYTAGREDVVPGDYVRLSVTDNGAGMAPEIVERVFEPFFTTKDVGMGSGLGLSMVYGFAKQSGGHVAIYSEEGRGTTVKLYLPRTKAEVARAEPEIREELPRGRDETILVVEDDPDIRELAIAQLEGLGYRVRVASDGKEALASLDEAPGIDLLLTDMVLPGGMGGRDLAGEVERRVGSLKVLFMSGYAEQAIHLNGWIDKGAELLQKPFRRRDLAIKVRAVLDRAPS